MNNTGTIGDKNTIPWHNPEDLSNFKNRTYNSCILMGRKTQESLPKFPLPNRLNLVLTSNPTESYHVSNIHDAIELAEKFYYMTENYLFEKNLWIIGGSSLYESTMDMTTDIILSVVDNDFNGDTKFPLHKMLEHGFEKTLEIQGYSVKTYIYKRILKN